MPKIEKKKGAKKSVRSIVPRPLTGYQDRRPRELIFDPRRLGTALYVTEQGAAFCVFNCMDGPSQTRQKWTLHKFKMCIRVVPARQEDKASIISDWQYYTIALVRAKISLDAKEILENLRPPPVVFTQATGQQLREKDNGVALANEYGAPNANAPQTFLPGLTAVQSGPAFLQTNQQTLFTLDQGQLQAAIANNINGTLPAGGINTPEATAARLLSYVEPVMIRTYRVQRDVLFSKVGATYYSPEWQKTDDHEYASNSVHLPELYNLWVIIRPNLNTNLMAFTSVEYDLDNN